MVNNLLIFIKKPELMIEPLEETFKYNLKGVWDIEYYSGT